jgi:hypothetical protein
MGFDEYIQKHNRVERLEKLLCLVKGLIVNSDNNLGCLDLMMLIKAEVKEIDKLPPPNRS